MDNRPFKNAVINAIAAHRNDGSERSSMILRASISREIAIHRVSIVEPNFANIITTACMLGDHTTAIAYTQNLPDHAPGRQAKEFRSIAIGLLKVVLLATLVALGIGLALLYEN